MFPKAAGVPHRFTGKLSAWSSSALSGLLHELGRHAGARQSCQQSIISAHRQPASRLLIDNFKNTLNDNRVRVHSSEAAEGKLFLLLVALHLHSVIQGKLAPSRSQMARRLTPREAMLELRRVKSVSYANGAVLIPEVAKRQRATLKLLGVPDELSASIQS